MQKFKNQGILLFVEVCIQELWVDRVTGGLFEGKMKRNNDFLSIPFDHKLSADMVMILIILWWFAVGGCLSQKNWLLHMKRY